MKKSIEVQKMELLSKLKKLEQTQKARQAESAEKFTKLIAKEAKAFGVDFAKIDDGRAKLILQKLFAELGAADATNPSV